MSRSVLKILGAGATLPQVFARGDQQGKDSTMKTTTASPDALAGAPKIVELRNEA